MMNDNHEGVKVDLIMRSYGRFGSGHVFVKAVYHLALNIMGHYAATSRERSLVV